MIPDNFISVIKLLASQCDRLGLRWAFTGSLNLALWGFILEPHDIDLETDCFGAEQIDLLHNDKATWPLHLRESDCMRSHFARYDIDGVQVEIMGDCQYHLPDGSWVRQRPLEKRIHRIEWRGLSLPLLKLPDEQESCQWMGRLEKAERIRAWLAEHPDPSTSIIR
ncbi:MAG: hypothetical protein JW704_02245 [Anaerolineaceae bacterium]|nr:hypothetical protein [Anaerolineaceae bacterium]MBN2676841.1 hypothetical protein [Anaerolineaceae bacterium]